MGVTVGKFPESRPRPPCMGEVMSQNTSLDMEYEYDLIIIGGGSGGIAAAKAAAKFGKRVALCDYVTPSPQGSSWGLGGTCVNVGCIPKKLMHQAALLGQSLEDSTFFGWNPQGDKGHDWPKLVKGIQKYIKSLNWGYKVTLHQEGVDYYNNLASFLDNHTLSLAPDPHKGGDPLTLTGENFIIAVGGRPKLLEIEGGQYALSSDDIFSLERSPGKVLLVGGSYVALECAGFLAGLGFDTTVLVRSILLRGFDQQMAELVGEVLEKHEVKLLPGWIPTKIEFLEEESSPDLPQYLVTSENLATQETSQIVYNTIIAAVGRDPCTRALHLDRAGVDLHPSSGKILTNSAEQSSIGNIYAVGDVAEGRPELTPVAIQAGVLLVKRLYGGQDEGQGSLVDYTNVPTTVFTPLEYGCVGQTEEDAIAEYGQDQIEVYHIVKQPLEFTLPSRDKTSCYSKLICLKSDQERVIGFHYLGPNAGEVTQGFALSIRLNAKKSDFDNVIGIHPTVAELFTTMTITKASGSEWKKTSC